MGRRGGARGALEGGLCSSERKLKTNVVICAVGHGDWRDVQVLSIFYHLELPVCSTDQSVIYLCICSAV